MIIVSSVPHVSIAFPTHFFTLFFIHQIFGEQNKRNAPDASTTQLEPNSGPVGTSGGRRATAAITPIQTENIID